MPTFIAGLIGSAMLVLLSDGVVANVVLSKLKGNTITPTKIPFNGTEDFTYTQVGVIAFQCVKIIDNVMIPLKVDFIINPEMDKFYTTLGFGVKFYKSFSFC